MIVFLDSGPLGLATNPKESTEAQNCRAWLEALTAAGHLPLVPEIIDYELRRELLLNDARRALARLDVFKNNGAYLPVSEAAYLQAAQFWATARRPHSRSFGAGRGHDLVRPSRHLPVCGLEPTGGRAAGNRDSEHRPPLALCRRRLLAEHCAVISLARTPRVRLRGHRRGSHTPSVLKLR